MILFADSGSTKTKWGLVGSDATVSYCTTGGMNPFYLGLEDMLHLLEVEFLLPRAGIAEIWFYGAGCTQLENKRLVTGALSLFFNKPKIHVNTDLLLAAQSLCDNRPGIACILGTGSNSCYYDGNKIINNVPPLGYVLGDEGSASVLGRRLISDILKKQMSKEICKLFFNSYRISADDILDSVYRKPFPNRYLAQFAKFISKNLSYPEMQTLARACLSDFFKRNVLQYRRVYLEPVHFTGSVAFHFRELISEITGEFGIRLGKINNEPLNNLIERKINNGELKEKILELSTLKK